MQHLDATLRGAGVTNHGFRVVAISWSSRHSPHGRPPPTRSTGALPWGRNRLERPQRHADDVEAVSYRVADLGEDGVGEISYAPVLPECEAGEGLDALPVCLPGKLGEKQLHEIDGFTFSFWTHVEPDPSRTPTAADCSAMLADEGIRSIQGMLASSE